MTNTSLTAPGILPVDQDLIEDITDIAKRLPVIERAVLSLIMMDYSQVEIAHLFHVRKNKISTIKISARNHVLEKFNESI